MQELREAVHKFPLQIKKKIFYTGTREFDNILAVYLSKIPFMIQILRLHCTEVSSYDCCHQMSDFKAKIHQIRFQVGLRPRPAGGAYSAPLDSLGGFQGA